MAVAGEAMETLKMKIFMLKKENTDVTEKMQEAEKVVDSRKNSCFWFMFHEFYFFRKRMKQMRESRKPRTGSKSCQNRSTAGSCCWMTTRTDFRRTST